MALFRITNLQNSLVNVPDPVGTVLQKGQSLEINLPSADSAALAEGMNKGLYSVEALNDPNTPDAIENTTKGAEGTATTIGSRAAPITLAATETVTVQHDLGLNADRIEVYKDGLPFTNDADLTIAEPDTDSVTVQSTAGGDFVIVVAFSGASLGQAMDATDTRLSIA